MSRCFFRKSSDARVAPKPASGGSRTPPRRRAKRCDRVVDVAAPAQRVAHLGAAQRVEVVQRVRLTISAPQNAFCVGQVEGQLGRRLRVRRVLEDEAHAVDRPSPAACGRRARSARRCRSVPRAGCLPRPVSTWPRALRSSGMPYMKLARRPMATPASTFSLVASSTKPLRRDDADAARRRRRGSTPSTPPKWSTWLCVKITATTGVVAEVLARERQRGRGRLARWSADRRRSSPSCRRSASCSRRRSRAPGRRRR